MMVDIPTLETERLILRGYRVTDLDDSLGLWSDPDVVRHISGVPSSREDVWARLLRYIGHWAVAGYGLWQIRERGSDRFVGEAGLAGFQRDMAFSFDGAPEAAWVLSPWSHGRGYATEAMTAALAWGAAAHPRTVCVINPDNLPSLRVAARLGYREIGRASYRGTEVIVLERLAPAA
jgi:RimJ/RimL family protein N-acetyltransferase